jgi:transposase
MSRKRKTKIQTQPIRPVINTRAAGVDIGAREIYAAVSPELDATTPVRCFNTFTDELKTLVAWFTSLGIATVAMEATSVYWIPLAELLEDAKIKVCLVNPQHVKNVPGRKTDVQDCQWLQYLHSVGLLRAAFRPAASVRAIRSLWRHRDSLVRQSAWHTQHVHKALDQMNIQIHHVIADITGKSGEAIVKAILKGERDPKALAALGDERLKASKQTLAAALTGDWREEHLFCLGQAREGYEFTLKQIAAVDEQLERLLRALAPAPAKSEPAQETPAQEQETPAQETPAKETPAQETPVQETPAKDKGKRKAKTRCGCPVAYDATQLLQEHLGVDLTLIPGINVNTAQTIYAELGAELDAFPSGKHFASWLGLNPNNKITGGKIISAHTKPHANRVKQALRMAAQGLHHADNELGEYYRRMRGKLGGASGVTAVAHRLARIIYAVMTTKREYDGRQHRTSAARRAARTLEELKRRAKKLGFELTAIQEPA